MLLFLVARGVHVVKVSSRDRHTGHNSGLPMHEVYLWVRFFRGFLLFVVLFSVPCVCCTRKVDSNYGDVRQMRRRKQLAVWAAS